MPISYLHTLETMGLERPALPDQLWRYMDFTKFAAMLENCGLYMSRLDRLGDAYEGWIPETPRARYRGLIQEEFFRRDRELRKQAPKLRKCIYVNCWHANDDESYAMWKLYVTENKGIAIQSTCRRLRDALKQTAESLSLYKVMYADQSEEPVHGGSMIRACLTKRPAFSHEREVRLVWWPERATGRRSKEAGVADGFYVPCDLDTLIERVLVAPASHDWFYTKVQEVIKKYGVNTEVVQSTLDLPPP
jgi:hypothetical protein